MSRPSQSGQLALGVVILGAGASRRMGRPKLLLPWGEVSVVGHLIGLWNGLGSTQTTVVCAADDLAMAAELDRLAMPENRRIVNPQPEQGMFGSVRCAAAWSGWGEELSHWAVVLGDQPHVHEKTLRALVDFCRRHLENICQPSRGGHGRHPVVLPALYFRQLKDCRETTLKEFLAARPTAVRRCELDDPGLDTDLDRPSDYAQALRARARPGSSA